MDKTRANAPKRKLGQIGKQNGTKFRCLQRKSCVSNSAYNAGLNESCSGLTSICDADQPGRNEYKTSSPVELAGDGSVLEQTKADIEKVNTSTAKENNKFELDDSGYESPEGFDELDESDVIIPNDISLSLKETQPKSIDRRTSWSRLSGDSPVENHLFQYGDLNTHKKVFGIIKNSAGPYKATAIRIIHEYQDSDQGDEFGATLRTYETIVKDERIRQHYLVGVEPRGPADKMRIKDVDEIVLLNDIFVPEKTHNAIIDLFHHVKVDGKTRLRLVIRRNGKAKSREKTYEWMETSAVLAPDYKQILDDQPIVERVESNVLQSDGYITKGYKRYRTRNRGLFIDISERGLIANTNGSTNGDRTKIIMRSFKYTTDSNGYLVGFVSLSDKDQKRYIFIENNRVTLKEYPDWFTVFDHGENSGAEGSNFYFRKNIDSTGTCIYLACNEDTGKMVVSKNVYRFEEFPGHVGVDRLDSGTGFNMDCSTSDTIPLWNTTRPNTRHLQLSLNTGKPRRYEKTSPSEIDGNNLSLSESSSQDLSTSEMETEDDRDNNFTAQPIFTPLKTPTTPMMALTFNK